MYGTHDVRTKPGAAPLTRDDATRGGNDGSNTHSLSDTPVAVLGNDTCGRAVSTSVGKAKGSG